MKEFAGKVAVVTGAASGIGRALAERFAGEGMKVALADVEGEALAATAKALESNGVSALPVVTDVSSADDVSALAERTLEAFGAVHVVCNNAGVFAGGPSWEAPLSDYEWLFGVNVWGVIHGIRTFVPILLEQGAPGHVVNTASMAGLTSAPLSGAYFASKHAVLSLSETLYHELAAREARVGVSVLCPEVIATRIGESGRNRPEHLARKEGNDSPERDLVEGAIQAAVQQGIPPARIAERVLGAIRDERFYVLSEPGDPWRQACWNRLDDIRHERNPSLAVPGAES